METTAIHLARPRRSARIQLRDLDALDAAGAIAIGQVAQRLVYAAMRAYRTTGDPTSGLADVVPFVADKLRAAMVAAHLRGRMRGYANAAWRLRVANVTTYTFAATDPYASTRRFLRQRSTLTAGEWAAQVEALGGVYAPEATRIATGLGNAMNAKLAGETARMVEEGVHVREGIARMRATAGIAKPLAETLFRTQHQLAYSAGRLAANKDPAIDEILWGYEYSAVMDARTRDEHAALDGMKLPKDDPRWLTDMPPNGYNCRCTVIEIFKDEPKLIADENQPDAMVKVDGKLIIPGPDKGFDFNAGDLFQDVAGATVF